MWAMKISPLAGSTLTSGLCDQAFCTMSRKTKGPLALGLVAWTVMLLVVQSLSVQWCDISAKYPCHSLVLGSHTGCPPHVEVLLCMPE